jgi:hypothetical protein
MGPRGVVVREAAGGTSLTFSSGKVSTGGDGKGDRSGGVSRAVTTIWSVGRSKLGGSVHVLTVANVGRVFAAPLLIAEARFVFSDSGTINLRG